MLVLSRSDVLGILTLPDCIEAVEAAFGSHALAHTLGPAVLGVATSDGGFHIKAAGLVGDRSVFAAKINANFPDNPRRFGLPTIQGMVMLADVQNGVPLAVIESGSITSLRTAAATAVAAKYLARSDAPTLTLVGCGVQGETQVAALSAGLPLQRVLLVDSVPSRAEALAQRVAARDGMHAKARTDLGSALAESNVCVTCTPSRRAFIGRGDVPAGMFFAAVGADSQGKQELDPALVASATLVVDVLDQCAEIGELQHALAAGPMSREDVHAELADVVVGRRPGRTRADEITVFDSSGTALEDVAAALAVYDHARAAGRGIEIALDA